MACGDWRVIVRIKLGGTVGTSFTEVNTEGEHRPAHGRGCGCRACGGESPRGGLAQVIFLWLSGVCDEESRRLAAWGEGEDEAAKPKMPSQLPITRKLTQSCATYHPTRIRD